MSEATKNHLITCHPRVIIDWEAVGNLCQIQCTQEEIAFALGYSMRTLSRRCHEDHNMTFGQFYKKHSTQGKMCIRRWQFDLARKGNTTMLIWLGKQLLEQKNEPEIEDEGEGDSDRPVFTVSMSRKGKFKNVRPVRSDGKED